MQTYAFNFFRSLTIIQILIKNKKMRKSVNITSYIMQKIKIKCILDTYLYVVFHLLKEKNINK